MLFLLVAGFTPLATRPLVTDSTHNTWSNTWYISFSELRTNIMAGSVGDSASGLETHGRFAYGKISLIASKE
jgi:hypothetical protein